MSINKKKYIFIVDDDEINNFICASLLVEVFKGYEIISNTNPIIALDQVKEHHQEILFTLLDINMPLMDGWEFLEKCNLENLIKFPIFMLTSSISNQDQEKSQKEPTIKGFIHKPLSILNLDEIQNTLNAFYV